MAERTGPLQLRRSGTRSILASGMRALYLSPHLSAQGFGGALFAATNLELLREVFAGEVTAAAVTRNPLPGTMAVPATPHKLGTALANLRGLAGTLTPAGLAFLRELLLREQPALVWLDTSILGAVIPVVRSTVPGARVVCAFQNVEADLIRQRIASRQVHYLPALYATWLNERLSAREADLTLALHAVDADRLHRLYGRRVDAILPIIVPDRSGGLPFVPPDRGVADPYVLFVGSAFPPNLEALDFICRDIAPRLRNHRVLAVGSGLDRAASRFVHPRLEIRGFVDNLGAVYRGAHAVIAPITSGGGMKVKIAEALMHGKVVVATPFAAVGYEACSGDSIRLASTGDEFAACIGQSNSIAAVSSARADYERLFSHRAGMMQMRSVIAAARVPPDGN